MWQGEDKTQVALSDELSVYIWENYVESVASQLQVGMHCAGPD